MSFKIPLLVATTAIGLSTFSFAAQAATVRVPLTYTFSDGGSTDSSGTGYFDIDDSLLAPNTNIAFPGNVNDLLGFSLTFTGLAGTPSTTTFTLADLTDWGLQIDATGAIFDINVDSSVNGDGYSLSAVDTVLAVLVGNAPNTSYTITPGTPVPLQSTPEPGSVVALLGLGLGALASKVKKQG